MKRAHPSHDQRGLNIVDPNDSLGVKTAYITLVQQKAMRRYLPAGTGRAADVGCGFGRLTPFLFELGYRDVRGIDPDPRLLEHARTHNPGPHYQEGGLPDLPLEEGSVDLLLFHNLLRVLKLMDQTERVAGCGRFLAAGGRLAVVDNVWPGRRDYWRWEELVGLVEGAGFELDRWWQIRRARWWPIFPIRYGLVPRRHLPGIAEHELDRLARRRSFSRWQYANTLLLFRRRSG